MPLYDYRCRACGMVFEVRATIKEKEQGLHPICPACQAEDTDRVVSTPMILQARGSDNPTPYGCGCGPSAGTGCCSR